MRGRGRGRDGHQRSPPRRERRNSKSKHENVYCLFCKVELTNQRLYNEHKESAVHKQKQILIEKALSDGLHFCYTCEKIFPSKIELDAHCLMSRHQPLYRVDEVQEVVKQEQVQEEPETPAEDQNENQQRRAKGDKERHNIVMELNKLTTDGKEEKDYDAIQNNADRRNQTIKKEHFCDICKVDCLNNSNFKVHVGSWRHRAELDKQREQEQKKFAEQAEQKFRESDDRPKTAAAPHMKTPSHLIEKNQFFCEVCSVPLNGETEYMNHLKQRKHLRQVNQLRRPFKCYICNIETIVESDFNYHLESRLHINKAFFKQNGSKDIKVKKEGKDWVEKKEESRSRGSSDRPTRDKRPRDKDESRDRGTRHDRRSDKKEANENSNTQSTKDNRKVEIVSTSNVEGPVIDLREKLKTEKIVITKPNVKSDTKSKERETEGKDKQPTATISHEEKGRVELDKRAKEMEFEVKFRKLAKEYASDPVGFQTRLTAEREADIAKYQEFEATYNRLCREEDYIREDLRVLAEGNPQKETFIRDMIKVQQEMRNVRQELEIREMMIIKRESLIRDRFPNDQENSPTEPVVIDYNHGNKTSDPLSPVKTKDKTVPIKHEIKNENDDLRIQLERERLLKRLGPELDAIDPNIKEKLMAAIFDKENAAKAEIKIEADKRQVVKDASKNEKRENQMKLLSEREKQLEKELADLKSTQKKKITTSLVPQYDDVDEKVKEKKKSSRRNCSYSSESSRSSSSNSDSSRDSRSRKKDRKKRRSSPGRSSSKAKSKRANSEERSRKKRHRSSSRERDKRNKRRDSDKKRSKSDRSKSEKKKPVKIAVKSKDKPGSRLVKSGNPLADPYETEEQASSISVIGGNSVSVLPSQQPPLSRYQQIIQDQHKQTSNSNQIPRKESNLFWKNPVAAVPAVDSPKEDVWDIAFSGGQAKEQPPDETLDLFNQEATPNQLSHEILNILRNVAPMLQQQQPPQQQFPPHQQSQHQQQQQQQREQRFQEQQQRSSLSFQHRQDIQDPNNRGRNLPPHMSSRQPYSYQPNQNDNQPTSTLFPVKTPATSTVTPLSTSTPLPGSGAGGRVRSILKKMKNPPKIEEAVVEVDSSSNLSSNSIPGLDLSNKPSNEDSKSSLFDNNLQQPNKSNLSYEQKIDDQNLYGGEEVVYSKNDQGNYPPKHHDEGKGYRGEMIQQGDERNNRGSPWSFNRGRNDDERSVSSTNSYERQSLGTPSLDGGISKPREDRLPALGSKPTDMVYRSNRFDERGRPLIEMDRRGLQPPVDDVRRHSPAEFQRRGVADVYGDNDRRYPGSLPPRTNPSSSLSPGVRPPAEGIVEERFGPPNPMRPRGRVDVELNPPVRMEGESNASYYERYDIYEELKQRREQDGKVRESPVARRREQQPPIEGGPPTHKFPDPHEAAKAEFLRRSQQQQLNVDGRPRFDTRPIGESMSPGKAPLDQRFRTDQFAGDTRKVEDERRLLDERNRRGVVDGVRRSDDSRAYGDGRIGVDRRSIAMTDERVVREPERIMRQIPRVIPPLDEAGRGGYPVDPYAYPPNARRPLPDQRRIIDRDVRDRSPHRDVRVSLPQRDVRVSQPQREVRVPPPQGRPANAYQYY